MAGGIRDVALEDVAAKTQAIEHGHAVTCLRDLLHSGGGPKRTEMEHRFLDR